MRSISLQRAAASACSVLLALVLATPAVQAAGIKWKHDRDDYRDHRDYHDRDHWRRVDEPPRHYHDRYDLFPRRYPPRVRTYHGFRIYRRYGLPYYGYGYRHSDRDALAFLAFTAITLVLLDQLSESQQRRHEQAQIIATRAPLGEPVIWEEGGASGSVTTTRIGTSARTGLQCREFQQTVTIGGRTEQAYGTACLQRDGSWEIVDTR